ncbi:uncharacterized protein [Euwallacea similis]|uniref:uncharacterized protein isoform X2 n=1 Tax=Euwallacea similis TaxID=1736056 RepID=UPI00344DD52F
MSITLQKTDSFINSMFPSREGNISEVASYQGNCLKLDVNTAHLKLWYYLKQYFACTSNEELLVKLLDIAQDYVRISTSLKSTLPESLETPSSIKSDFTSTSETNTPQAKISTILQEVSPQNNEDEIYSCTSNNSEKSKLGNGKKKCDNKIDNSIQKLPIKEENDKAICRYCDGGHSYQNCLINNPHERILDSVDIASWSADYENQQDVDNVSFAKMSLPSCLKLSKEGGVITQIALKPFTRFGPLVGKKIREVEIHDDCDMQHIWELQLVSGNIYINTEDPQISNWVRFVRPAPTRAERNLSVVIADDSLFFINLEALNAGDELLYWQDTFVGNNKKKGERTVCGGCNMTFQHPLYYKVHCSLFHDTRYSLAIRKYHCKVCGAAILGKENIRKHATEQHNGKGAYQCQYCKKFFLRLSYLEMHKTYGCSSNPLRSKSLCDFCGRKFCQPQKLRVHIKRMHSNLTDVLKDFQCKNCKKVLGSRAALQRHVKEVHEKQAATNYLCTACGKNFQNRSNLKIHMLTHSGIKPFKCSIEACSSAFTTKQCLQLHYKKIHNFDEDSMPKIERSVSYTFQAYSGGEKGKIEDQEEKEESSTKIEETDTKMEEMGGTEDIFEGVDLPSPVSVKQDMVSPQPNSESPLQSMHTIDNITKNYGVTKLITKGSKKWMADDMLNEPFKPFPTFGTQPSPPLPPKSLQSPLHKYTSISEFTRRETSNASLLVEAALDSVCNDASIDIDVEVSHNCSDTLVNNIYNLSENSGLPGVSYNIQETQDISLISPSVNDHISVTDELEDEMKTEHGLGGIGYGGMRRDESGESPGVGMEKELNLSHRFGRTSEEGDNFPSQSPRRYDFVESINPGHLSSDDSTGLPHIDPNNKQHETEQDMFLHRKSSFRMYDYFKRLRFDENIPPHQNVDQAESEVQDITGNLGKEDKDNDEPEIAADMRSKFDLDLDFRVRHYETTLDSDLNRQRPYNICMGDLNSRSKNSDVLNMSADNRDLIDVDFRSERHFEPLPLNSDLQGLDMSTRGFHNYSSNINRYHHVYPELDRMDLRLNYTPPPYDLVRVVSLDLTPPGRHSVDLSLRTLPLHQIPNSRLLTEHGLTNKHRIFDQARLLAGDLGTRMTDNRLIPEPNRLLPDSFSSDRILGNGTDQSSLLSEEPRLLSDHPRILDQRPLLGDPHLMPSGPVPAAPSLSAFGSYTGVSQPTYHSASMDPRAHVTSPVNGGYHHPYSTYYP